MTHADDAMLDHLARALRQPSRAPGTLWQRIEADLRAQRARTRKRHVVTATLLLAILVCFMMSTQRAAATSLVAEDESRALLVAQERWQDRVAALTAQLAATPPAAGDYRTAALRAQLDLVTANVAACRARAIGNALNRNVRLSLISSYRQQADVLQSLLFDMPGGENHHASRMASDDRPRAR